MNHNRLRDLVARYEAAETSLAEERELAQLLRAPGIPDEFVAYRKLFAASTVLAKAAPQKPLDNPWELPVETARIVKFSSNGQAQPTTRPGRIRYLRWASVAAAAVLVLALTVGLFQFGDTFNQPDQPIASAQTIDWSKYEVTDPAEARRITAGALGTLTRNIDNSGRITSREVGRIHPIQHAFKL